MKKWNFLFVLTAFLSVSSAQANIRPRVSLNLGADVFNSSMNQNITLISPFQNNFAGKLQGNPFVGGMLVGFETPVNNMISAQLGLSFYSTNPVRVNGSANCRSAI